MLKNRNGRVFFIGKSLDVSLAHLKEGVYIVTLKGDGFKKSLKIVK